jgi:hypothetical protein
LFLGLAVLSVGATSSLAQSQRLGTVADEEEMLAAVAKDRLRWGLARPSISGLPDPDAEHYDKPIYRICLSLPKEKDPSDGLLRRFGEPYKITRVSECKKGMRVLVIGPVRWLDENQAEVGWSGLGNAGSYLVKRDEGRWKAIGPIGGFVG